MPVLVLYPRSLNVFTRDSILYCCSDALSSALTFAMVHSSLVSPIDELEDNFRTEESGVIG